MSKPVLAHPVTGAAALQRRRHLARFLYVLAYWAEDPRREEHSIGRVLRGLLTAIENREAA